MRETTCCFSGHREVPNIREKTWEYVNRLENEIKELYFKGYTDFITGGAVGFDTLCAFALLRLKSDGYNVKLIVAVPYRNQSEKWSAEDRAKYEVVLKYADEVICLSEEYYQGCYEKRNKYMVDMSSAIICYLEKVKSGTSQTVDYAKRKGLVIHSVILK